MRARVWALVALACYIQALGVSAQNSSRVAAAATARNSSRVVRYVFDVKVGSRSPDCVSRPVILVSGQFQPTITVRQGDTLEVRVTNNLPAKWPAVSNGIALHWHGFHLKGQEWYDGTGYVSQCPISRGQSFTYRIKVDETPGTYFWHDHAALNRADGLQGALVVLPAGGAKELYAYGADRVLFLQDWWHFTGDSMAMRLNRPFDDAKVTNTSGAWFWVGVPKSVLINGKGRYQDCEDVYTRKVNATMRNGTPAAAKDLMTPPSKAGQLGPTAAYPVCNVTRLSEPKCSHEVINVKPGGTTLLRLINAATLVYMTVCVGGHSVTLVALDGNPVAPRTFRECVDINSGQRADILVKADQKVDNYWISVVSQFRKGAPAAYAVLRYGGAPARLPAGPLVQPEEGVGRMWGMNTTMSLKAHPLLLNPASNRAAADPYFPPGSLTTQRLPPGVDKRFVIQSTQPLLEANGILRWALDNVAHAKTPPCASILDLAYVDDSWAAKNAIQPSWDGLTGYFKWGQGPNSVAGSNVTLQVVDASTNKDVLIKAKTPRAATHVMSLPLGKIVEIVVQNYRAGAFGGEYGTGPTNARGGREQHPFHLHGHRFWLVGLGNGSWDESKVAGYNTKDPLYRDTGTVFFDGAPTDTPAGWVALRFVTDNPGVWPFHCHIAWHQFMGQQINIIEGTKAQMSEPPSGMPKCSKPCIFNMAPFTLAFAKSAVAPEFLAPANSSQLA